MTKDALPEPDPPRRVLRIEISAWSVVGAVLVIAVVWILVRLLPVLLALVAALFLVGTLNPTVSRLEERGWSRLKAISLVFSALAIGMTVIGVLTIPALISQIGDLIEQEPVLRKWLVDTLSSMKMTASMAESLRDIRYDELMKASAANLLSFSTRMVEIFAYSVAAVFLALYVMIDRDRLRGALFAIVPRNRHVTLARVMLNLQTIVGGYIRGQAITCLFIAGFMFAVLAAFGVPNALALATFGAIADILPIIGPVLSVVPAVAAALTVSKWTALAVFLLLMAYEEFESRVVIPMVYGRALRLPSSVVLFALLAGATLAGVVGALLALPVAATILMLIEELRVELPGDTKEPEAAKIIKQEERHEKEYLRRTENMPVERAAEVAIHISENQIQDRQDKAAEDQAKTD